MRVSREQADKNREHVIDIASCLFRERGFEGIGVADLMKEAGLTHGGFYGQFKSKEDLKVQASRHALSRNKDRWAKVIAEIPDEKLAALARFYLSDAHRDRRGEGCALAALGGDAPRYGPELQAAFKDGIEGYLEFLDGIMSASSGEERRDKTIAALSTMVGALVLSRAVGDEALSQKILSAAAGEIAAKSE
ncbi:TetR/AcrR family transcriptional regulator [Microvirga tunisiensis]|uniref:TetR/AcrR family transcriptional regulator n=1 Tax=Microvirga tunisiensis TaxID=2108360 RepID=A0A5N7MNS0_9HYPH|nr:TetR/AcrR family transcriptional regulator [Microvirga tunisiensis]MPR09917.1 TetR/AcrR family transcriptional regulator [Microvirga tunisiensis]MPR28109.1 TetR/AcrR family transcriptional regulator [Microvirga tunisiensis]